jgi:hypothetical protein
MRRREFLGVIGGAAAAWPLAARAQQNVRRIGVLMMLPERSREGQAWVAAGTPKGRLGGGPQCPYRLVMQECD